MGGEVAFQAVALLLCNGTIVPLPEIGLLIKVVGPIKWIQSKRGWYSGQTGIVQGQRPLYHIPPTLMPLTAEAIAAIGRALSNDN
jgi:hypothetical protein